MASSYIPLDGLGMTEEAMLELVNRLNAHDDRKWVFVRGSAAFNQMRNANLGNPYINHMANTLREQTYN